MPVESYFPTQIYRGRLPPSTAQRLNHALAHEIDQLESMDLAGRRWSKKNYWGGYSSYGSLDNLHKTSPNFAELEALLRPHVNKYALSLGWSLAKRVRSSPQHLHMTTCWANKMGQGTYHGLHIHPYSAISGCYYVSMPAQASELKLEDPRLGFMMSAPALSIDAPAKLQNYVRLGFKPGEFILFESWIRHEVPPNRSKQPRVSISFNFEL